MTHASMHAGMHAPIWGHMQAPGLVNLVYMRQLAAAPWVDKGVGCSAHFANSAMVAGIWRHGWQSVSRMGEPVNVAGLGTDVWAVYMCQ